MTAKQQLAALYTEAEEAWQNHREQEGRSEIPAALIHVEFQLKRNFIQTMTEEEAAKRLDSMRRYVDDIRNSRVGFSDGHAAKDPDGSSKGSVVIEEAQVDDGSAVRDMTEKLIGILNRPDSPLRTIWQMVNDPSVDWSSDDRDWKKGYVMACFSELVYLRMSKYEVPGRDRYRVIPSSALQFLLEHSIQIDLERLLRGGADIASATGDAGRIVFGAFVFPQFTIVAVRGTMPWLNDWLLDLDERRITVGELMYHHGFYSEANGALKDVAAAVPEDRPIYFTGHSLGGALATLLPGMWPGKQRLMTPYSFASPRVGNDKVAQARNVYAYVRAADPVPHLPPYLSGFRNSGWPVTVIPTGDVWLSGWEVGAHLFKAVSAHKMEQYRKLMAEESGAPYHAADVYFKRLQELMVDAPGL